MYQADLFNQIADVIRPHTRENNRESEAILAANLPRISRQCELVLSLLKEGKRLTVRSAIVDYGISSLPRRILDLKQSGFKIKSELIDKKYKEYYL